LLGTVKEIDSTVVLKDVYYTPLNGTYMGKAYPDMHGLVVQANIISMIIDDKYINSSPDWMVFIFSFILVYFNMALFAFLNDKYEKLYEVTSLAAFVVESLTILALTIYFFHKFSYELKATMPIFSIALSILLFEIYHSSLKPLTLKLFHKLTNKEIHHESN
jgi:CHASE2 domain-containing sensor protein